MSDLEAPYEDWVAKAESDLLNIENNIAAARVPWDTVCFHAQQAGEKYLKALLVKHRVPFPRTHDLVALLTLAAEVAPDIASLKNEAVRLTPYAIGLRYPLHAGLGEPEGREAIEAARRIRAKIVPLLGTAQ